jgi:hypothetical protein
LVSVVMYVVQQIKYYKGMYLPNLQQTKGEEVFFEMFNDTTLGNAYSALSFVPVVSLLMLFILFRAENQGIDIESDSNYQAVSIGMCIATIGILVQAVDGMLVNVRSQVVSNISETIGTLFTYTGFAFLIAGMLVVRSSVVPMSTAANCLVALALLLLVLMITTKILQLKKRFADDHSMPINLGIAGEMMEEHRIEEIRSSAQFSQVLMIAFFYLHFRYVRLGAAPDTANGGIIASTVGVFLQATSVVLKLVNESAGSVLNILSMLLLYGAFGVTMYSAIDAGWPAPSQAIEVVLILLFIIAFLKFIIVITQEVAGRFLRDDAAGEGGESFARLTKLFHDMMGTTGYASIVCILLLYVHFRAAFLLKVEPQDFIDNMRGLKEMMLLVLVSIFVQMVAQLIELGLGPHGVLGLVVTVSIAGVNIGVAGIAIAAVST